MVGDDRQIHNSINLTRDAIQAVSKMPRSGCGIVDMDYQAAFDFLVMNWVFLVLQKKGVSEAVINRLRNLYTDNISIVVVNNIEGKESRTSDSHLAKVTSPTRSFLPMALTP